MRCQECLRQKRPHTVTLDHTEKTLMVARQWWDNDDKLHVHDENTTTFVGLCNMGHAVTKKEKKPCPVWGCEFQKPPSQVESEKAMLESAREASPLDLFGD